MPDKPSPKLMVRVNRCLSDADLDRLQTAVDRVVAGEDVRCLVVEPGIDVCQLIDGRWSPVFAGPAEVVGVSPSEAMFIRSRPIDPESFKRAWRDHPNYHVDYQGANADAS